MTDRTGYRDEPVTGAALRKTCAIAIRGVTKNYGSTEVLRSIDLDVPAGALTAVLGASGSGKTTLLRLIAGFDTIDTGTISIAGRLVDDGRSTVRAQHRGIGYVPQDAALFPHLTVSANIGFGVPRRQRAGLADLIELVGLTGYEHRHPHELSGGQQQRVALARALAIKPHVVLLDEPFSSLDAALRMSVRSDVVSILTESNTTTVLVTHDQDEALSIADHVALITDGRVTASGAPQDLYEHPPTPDIAAAVGLANIIAGSISGGQVHCVLGPVTMHSSCRSDIDTACQILVRPEQLAVSAAPRPDSVRATVDRIRYHGHDTLIDLKLEAPSRAGAAVLLTARSPGRPAFQSGQPAHITISGEVHTWT